MADSKITALTSISTSTDPANDPLVIVDVSDTSMAATGTTKKVTLNQLLGASGTATLASATITGNLTLSAGTANGVGYLNGSKVFTAGSALVFDGTNLGVGGTGQLRFATSGGAIGDNSIGTENSFSMMLRCGRGSTSNIELASDKLVFGTAASERYKIDSTGVATWSNVGGVAGTAMTLNATGLGVGVSPAFKLSAAGVSQFYAEADGIYASGNSSPDLYTIGVNYYNAAGTEGVKVSARPSWKIEHKNSNDALAYLDIGFRAASAAASAFTSRFKIDGSGNVISNVTGTAPTLATNSQMVFNLTSNTNLRISVRGTDGVTRTANITLA